MRNASLFVFVICVGLSPVGQCQTSTPPQDPAAVWKILWEPAMDAEKSARVENVEVMRDRVHIVLSDGAIQFTKPANGVVFGAVFRGTGRVSVEPPNPIEAGQLRHFTKQDKLNMEFSEATFTFSDNLLEEIAKSVKWTAAGSGDDAYTKRQRQREDLGAAIVPRLLQSVLSGDRKRTAFFLADLKTKEKGWVQFTVDSLDPEEVRIGRWVDVGPVRNFDIWMSFPAGQRTSAEAWSDPLAKADFAIKRYEISAGVTSGAELHATTKLQLEPRASGDSVLNFFLDSNLRVETVADEQGHPLVFFQAREEKDRLQSYGNYVAVVLGEPLKVAQNRTLTFRYGGKRAIRKAGNGNYFCESFGWYPTLPDSFATRADFELTFHSPKNSTLVATGEKVSETTDGNTTITAWKSEIPLAVAGLAYGDYKLYNDKAGGTAVNIYANRQADDVMSSVQQYFEHGPGQGQAAVGTLTPSSMAKTMGVEMANTIRVFENYYGPYPYKQLAVTSMPISYSYGQGWPGLIYLWSGSFLDATQRHAMGMKDEIRVTDFFRAHESSHQWWGHRVGWKSYHDQWLSEGFAEFSGYLYIQYRDNMKEYFSRLRKAKETLRTSDIKGHRIETIGPIWLGQRIASSETGGGSYQDLIYSKGGYVLHMLRMMLHDFRNADRDHLFKDMMHDYCKTFDNKAASTEDFKAIVEKHMSLAMDLDGSHKMDWFFDQYVYGTGIPQYDFRYKVEATPEGKFKVSGTVSRSGVPESWKDLVPLYLHQGQGLMRVGFVNATSPATPFEFITASKPEKLTVNDYEDLLAEVRQ